LPAAASDRPKHGDYEHDYHQILRDMAARLGVRAPINLEGLHEYLQAND
jgi:hypothetical protein